MENLDVFDADYQPLDPPSASIDVVHQDGLWHQTFACWLVNRARRTVILQLRGPNNRIDPGSFDASASGHLVTGETPDQGFRELEEELGVTVKPEDRIYLGYFRNMATRQDGKYINRGFCHIYLAPCDLDLGGFRLQAGEVEHICEMDVADGIALFSRTQPSVTVKMRTGSREITIEDMCNYQPRVMDTNYYLSVFKAARDFANGVEIRNFKCLEKMARP